MRPFEDYCWRDVLTPEMERIFSAYQRERTVAAHPALIVIHPPGSFTAVAQPHWHVAVLRLLATARAQSLPVIHSVPSDGAPFAALAPLPSEKICRRPADSAFLFTDLEPLLTRSGADGVVICGAPTSGAVRVSAVEAKSFGYKVALAEETTGDEASLLHMVALFDVAHKYADVMSLDELLAAIAPAQQRGVS